MPLNEKDKFKSYKLLTHPERVKILDAIGELRELYYKEGNLPSSETVNKCLKATGHEAIARTCYNAQVAGEVWP